MFPYSCVINIILMIPVLLVIPVVEKRQDRKPALSSHPGEPRTPWLLCVWVMVNIINISNFPFTKCCSNIIKNSVNELVTNLHLRKSLIKGIWFMSSLQVWHWVSIWWWLRNVSFENLQRWASDCSANSLLEHLSRMELQSRCCTGVSLVLHPSLKRDRHPHLALVISSSKYSLPIAWAWPAESPWIWEKLSFLSKDTACGCEPVFSILNSVGLSWYVYPLLEDTAVYADPVSGRDAAFLRSFHQSLSECGPQGSVLWSPGQQCCGPQSISAVVPRAAVLWSPGQQCCDLQGSVLWSAGQQCCGPQDSHVVVPKDQCYGHQDSSAVVPRASVLACPGGVGRKACVQLLWKMCDHYPGPLLPRIRRRFPWEIGDAFRGHVDKHHQFDNACVCPYY